MIRALACPSSQGGPASFLAFRQCRDWRAPRQGHAVEMCEPMGSETSVELSFEGQRLRLRVPGLHHFEPGSTQAITWDFSNADLFDTKTGAHL